MSKLETLRKRQDQCLAAYKTFEGIRWKFSSAFGLVATALLAFYKNPMDSSLRSASILIFLAATIAGLVIQIRLFALMTNMWDKLIKLQNMENTIVNAEQPVDDRAEWHTDALALTASARYTLATIIRSVHSMICLQFATLLGAGFAVSTLSAWSLALQICYGAIVAIVIWATTLFLGYRYAHAMEQGFDSNPRIS